MTTNNNSPLLPRGWQLFLHGDGLLRRFDTLPGQPTLRLRGAIDGDTFSAVEAVEVEYNGEPADTTLHMVNGRVNTCWAEPQSLFSACKAAERALFAWFHRNTNRLSTAVYPGGAKPRRLGGSVEVAGMEGSYVVVDYAATSDEQLFARVLCLNGGARCWVLASRLTPVPPATWAQRRYAKVDPAQQAEAMYDSLGLCCSDAEASDD